MEQQRPDPTDVLTNYDAIVRRVHEERSKAMSEMLAGIARFVSRCWERVVCGVISALHPKRRCA